jgi:hypothetical protein
LLVASVLKPSALCLILRAAVSAQFRERLRALQDRPVLHALSLESEVRAVPAIHPPGALIASGAAAVCIVSLCACRLSRCAP